MNFDIRIKGQGRQICLLKIAAGKKRLLHLYDPLISNVWTDIHRVKHNKYRDIHPSKIQEDIDKLLIILRNKLKIVSNYFAEKNEKIRDLSLLRTQKILKR
jgi:site-specific DNA-methyltransferase (adenine-specific)